MKSRVAPSAAVPAPADLAKAALRRLVAGKLEPTPENYARAYRAEGGQAVAAVLPERALPVFDRLVAGAAPQAELSERKALTQELLGGRWELAERTLARLVNGEAQAAALAGLVESIVRGVERGGRQWTVARRKDSLQRVLSGTRIDAQLLQRRLTQLVASWDGDSATDSPEALDERSGPRPSMDDSPSDASPGTASTSLDAAPLVAVVAAPVWAPVVNRLAESVQAALPPDASGEARDLPAMLATLVQAISVDGATPQHADALAHLCARADQVVQHRHHLVDQLCSLCLELTASLGDLAEDDSWAKGQLDAMRLTLEGGITARGVRSVGEVLRHTREHQAKLRGERGRAREALKSLMNQMLHELGDLGSRTGLFQENVGRYADAIEGAESLEGLTGVVGEMLHEARSVQEIVGQTQQRLQSEHARASDLSARVVELESELRRLSDEVSTDQLTQVANRRGLMQAFEAAEAELADGGPPLAIGLLDIDNFKRLNDELGHTVGDEALRSLASVVSKSLRPADVVARFGGEEFVVLLPATGAPDGQQILTRLQRSLSVGLFMHERKTVFVTFSAGVTAFRPGETIEQALERADAALYVAKRSGKNRTCIG